MTKAKTPLKIPFDKKGNLLDWTSSKFPDPPGGHWESQPNGAPSKFIRSGEWRDNYVFHAILTVTGSERGRSAARVTLQDEEGHEYIMFLTDTVHLLQNAKTIAYGMIEGDWTFQKRGSNYGVKLA